MICKFFSNKKGGGVSAINYLLNEREEEGTAKVIKGNEQLTRKIIHKISNKQKVTVGVLSFEEKRIPDFIKEEMMQSFEETLFAGMDKNDYNILWVEHNDKGRVELNFVIPKINLSTKKALQPYYHMQDFPLLDKWQQMQNESYAPLVSNPKDPAKKRSVRTNIKNLELVQDYKSLDELIQESVTGLNFSSRDELIQELQNHGYKITRQNDQGISIKLPNKARAKKFTGGIYEQWNSVGELKKKFSATEREIKEFSGRDTHKEHKRLEAEYRRYLQDKSTRNQQKHQPKIKQSDREYRTTQEHDKRSLVDVQRDINTQFDAVRHIKDISRKSTIKNGQKLTLDINRHDTQEQGKSVYIQDIKRSDIQRKERNIPNPSTREIDEHRATATRSIRRINREEQELINECKRTRERVQEQYSEHSEELRENHARATERTLEAIDKYHATATATQSECIATAEDSTATKSRIVGAIKAFSDGFRELVSSLKEKAKEIYQEATQTSSQGFMSR